MSILRLCVYPDAGPAAPPAAMTDDPMLIATRSLGRAEARPRVAGSVLVIVGDTSRRHALPATGALTVGRAADADIRADDPSVSRHHARLAIVRDQVAISDLASRNGTLVNGAAVTGEQVLLPGDVVTLGEATLLVQRSPRGVVHRALLDRERIVDRLVDETARAARFERPLAAAVIALGAAPAAPARIETAVADALPAGATAGWLAPDHVLLVVPELGEAAITGAVTGALDGVASIAPAAHAGIARCPDDGGDADTLLARARAALDAEVRVAWAERAVEQLTLGDRTIVVADAAMSRAYQLLRRLAVSDVPVLVCGETGVGKDNAAYAVHAWSKRSQGPLVAINCAAIPEALLESELFGHEQGAFSGAATARAGVLERADGGTVFLDEVGDLSPAAQAKLLRALETGTFLRVGDVRERAASFRLVAATNRDLDADVAAGKFRGDLFFRIGTALVTLPPLRERTAEIAVLARALLAAACERMQREPPALSAATLWVLSRYPWPGNVRELRNAMDYVAAAATDIDEVAPWHLPGRVRGGDRDVAAAAVDAPAPNAESPTDGDRDTPFRPIADELADLERRRMAEALELAHGVKSHAAELIGMPRRTFMMKIRKYGL